MLARGCGRWEGKRGEGVCACVGFGFELSVGGRDEGGEAGGRGGVKRWRWKRNKW